MGAGAEVLSRVSFALENDISYLQEIILKDIQLIWNGFKGKIGIVGNTVMMYLLLGENIKELSYAPFQISLKGGIWRTLKEKNLYSSIFWCFCRSRYKCWFSLYRRNQKTKISLFVL